jgi:TM2 domain-containing membrane protein YozV
MAKFGAAGLIMVAAVLFATGLVLRMDLIDWLIDAIGFMFLAAGVITGVVGLLKLVMGGRGREATSV